MTTNRYNSDRLRQIRDWLDSRRINYTSKITEQDYSLTDYGRYIKYCYELLDILNQTSQPIPPQELKTEETDLGMAFLSNNLLDSLKELNRHIEELERLNNPDTVFSLQSAQNEREKVLKVLRNEKSTYPIEDFLA